MRTKVRNNSTYKLIDADDLGELEEEVNGILEDFDGYVILLDGPQLIKDIGEEPYWVQACLIEREL